MTDFLINYSWCIWLGGTLGLLGINVNSWKWWVIVVPIVILVNLSKGTL